MEFFRIVKEHFALTFSHTLNLIAIKIPEKLEENIQKSKDTWHHLKANTDSFLARYPEDPRSVKARIL